MNKNHQYREKIVELLLNESFFKERLLNNFDKYNNLLKTHKKVSKDVKKMWEDHIKNYNFEDVYSFIGIDTIITFFIENGCEILYTKDTKVIQIFGPSNNLFVDNIPYNFSKANTLLIFREESFLKRVYNIMIKCKEVNINE